MSFTALTSPAITTAPTIPSRLLPAAEFETAVDAYLTDCNTRDGEINAMIGEVNTLVAEMNAEIFSPSILTLGGTQQSTSTTLADVTGLTPAVVANATYEINAFVTFQSAATTTGLKLGFTSPASANPMLEIVVPIATGDVASALRETFPSATETTSGSVTGTGVTAINSNHTAQISGILKTGGTAGNFAIQFATEVGSSAITLQAGSTLVLKRIA